MGAEEKVRGRQIGQWGDGDCGPERRRGGGHHIDRHYNSPVHWAKLRIGSQTITTVSCPFRTSKALSGIYRIYLASQGEYLDR